MGLMRFDMVFSYGQFFVYDVALGSVGLDWTDVHVAQGFARQESVASFATLPNWGVADVCVTVGPFPAGEMFERVIAVPFEVASGEVSVSGPEEDDAKLVHLDPGHYRLTVGQRRVTGHHNLFVELSLEQLAAPIDTSEILLTDDGLDPPAVLAENAESVVV